MNAWIAPLTAFSAAVAARQPHRFAPVVRGAYEAGASREELLAAVDSARLLTQVPAPIVDRACATIQAWYWMEAPRAWHRWDAAPRAA